LQEGAVILSQHYLGCLSHASYLVGDETSGRAVVVDPQRDVSAYLTAASSRGLTITHVIETHFHADFVSGHLELAAKTGAEICYGAAAGDTSFPMRRLSDGERLALGDGDDAVVLEVWETPGHTPESISVLVYEHAGDDVPYGVLTGDTLFIGDVGRPDLLASVGVTADELAGKLYASTRRLLTLHDDVRVFPAHGAGSACGKNLSTETESTIGEQRRSNYAMQDIDEDEFVRLVTEGQSVAPLYFGFDAQRNREMRALLDETTPPPALTIDEVVKLQADGAVVLDTRDPQEFAAGHLRGSRNVGLNGRFAEYAGDVIRPDDRVVVVGEPGTETEAMVRLARIGFDVVVGYLDKPYRTFVARPDLVVSSSRVTAAQLDAARTSTPHLVVVDVRNPGEIEASGAIPGARSIPLARLLESLDGLDPSAPTVVHCAGGYRSSIAASVLASVGFTDVSDLVGGYDAWAATAA
jgi:glyoxylase-like metal-dependent hydrolase (beta-lactamase superfamily II)/rhodanese-related sulfurtransferase